MTPRNIADAVAGFLQAAEWTTLDDAEEEVYLDDLGLLWSSDAVLWALSEVRGFLDRATALEAAALEAYLENGNDFSKLGHDLWMDSHGHGCGFVDEGVAGKKLYEHVPYSSTVAYAENDVLNFDTHYPTAPLDAKDCKILVLLDGVIHKEPA